MKIKKLHNIFQKSNFKFFVSDEQNLKVEKLQILSLVNQIIFMFKKKKFKNIVIFSDNSHKIIACLIAISYFGGSIRIEDIDVSDYELKQFLKKKSTIFYLPEFLLKKKKKY